MKFHGKWLLLLSIVIVLFFWKLTLTSQFSILLGYEGANCSYASWSHFPSAALKQGVLPLWDPYLQSGRSFIGDMQAGLFYPLKIVTHLWPLDRAGLFSEKLFHWYFVFTHLLAAGFMFLLARELGLAGYAALVAALCFSLGGFMGQVNWPFILDSAIWLPLVLLCLLRALRAEETGRRIRYAGFAGLGLGMSVLGGGLHLLLMQVLVVVSAAVYHAFQTAGGPGPRPAKYTPWVWSAAIIVVAGVVSCAFGAVQLLPSIEYGTLSVRFLSGDVALPPSQKIPYAHISSGLWPRGVLALLLIFTPIGHSEFSPYFGVLPLLLAMIGIWRNWNGPWVRYLTALAGLAFFYSLGEFSFLHGLLYALVPFLSMSREAGRFLYLMHFAMALLAGFGVQTLFAKQGWAPESYRGLARVLRWVVIVMAAAVGLPALYVGKPEIGEWTYFSFLLILATYGLFVYILRRPRTRSVQCLLVALILCDLYVCLWAVQNKIQTRKSTTDHRAVLLGCRKVAQFFKSQPGLFRVHMEAEWPPSFGTLYGVYTTGGFVASTLPDYAHLLWAGPRGMDLMNARFIMRAKAVSGATPVYQDNAWYVYENPSHYPRAWIVHQVVTEPSSQKALQRLMEPSFDPLNLALVSGPLGAELQPKAAPTKEEVTIPRYQPDRMELAVHAQGRGLLVLSEAHYPGWQATVNGQPVPIHKVNGSLRGVVVPGGESRVILRYAPRSVLGGAILTGLTLLGTLGLALAQRLKAKQVKAR